jgi:bifunctional DNase/RNase
MNQTDDLHEAEIWGIAKAGDGSMVFLRAKDSDLSVPIFIGQLEAQAILIGYSHIEVARPLTADLLLEVIKKAGLSLARVEVNQIRDNTFYASIILQAEKEPGGRSQEPGGRSQEPGGRSQGPLTVDARPSDALALAVRAKCPIFVTDSVLEEAGIPSDDIIEEDAGREALQAELDAAVAAEEYEKAAEIRDKLKQLNDEESEKS